jgi:hypothetical protein
MSGDDKFSTVCTCGKSLKISAKLLGKKVKCPSCSREFVATRPPEDDFDGIEIEDQKVTGTIIWPALSGSGTSPIEVYFDSQLVGLGTVNEGVNDSEFMTTTGDHVITVQQMPGSLSFKKLLGTAKQPDFMQKYNISLKTKGHYKINFQKPSLLKLFKTYRFSPGYDLAFEGNSKDFVAVVEPRKNVLIGIWYETAKRKPPITFTKDGMLLFEGSPPLKYRWKNYENLDVLNDLNKVINSFRVITLSDHEISLMIDNEVFKFQRGQTKTEAEEAKIQAKKDKEFFDTADQVLEVSTSALVGLGSLVAGAASAVGSGLKAVGDLFRTPCPKCKEKGHIKERNRKLVDRREQVGMAYRDPRDGRIYRGYITDGIEIQVVYDCKAYSVTYACEKCKHEWTVQETSRTIMR